MASGESQSLAKQEVPESSVLFAPLVAAILGAFAIGSAISIWDKTGFPIGAHWLMGWAPLVIVGVGFGLGMMSCRREAHSGNHVG